MNIKENKIMKLRNSVDIKLPKITNLNYNNYVSNYINNILNNNLNHIHYPKPHSGKPYKYIRKNINQINNIYKKKERDIITANPFLISKSNKFIIKNKDNNLKLNFNNKNYFKFKNSKSNNILINNNLKKNNNNFNKKNSLQENKSKENKFENFFGQNKMIINIKKIKKLTNNPSFKLINNQNKNLNEKKDINYYYMEFANKEHRKTMEDFHLELPNLNINNLNIKLFGIFDGHSGFEVSKFCSENFSKYFIKEFSKFSSPNDEQIIKILNNIFSTIDNDINTKLNFSNSVGSTATILFIYNNKFFCANVGDSKCFIIKKDNKINLITKDHNCLDEEETKRIKESGGIVFNKRVFGTLMLTRSLGDKEMKQYGVISKPYIYYDNLNEINFIIIASDGVWDVINEKDLLELSKNCKDNQVLCKKIMDLTKERDSRDNISILVVNNNE